MKLYIKLLFLFLILESCVGQINCNEVQTGKFELIDEEIGYHTIIERDANFQTETNKKTGDITKCSVRWVDDCNYVLKYIETDNDDIKKYIGTELNVEITEIDRSKIYFTTMFEGSNEKMSFNMKKIE